MKINLVKAETTYLSSLCAGDVFQTANYKNRYFMKTDGIETDGIEDETLTVIDLETGALYDMPDTTEVILKKAILNIEEF